MADLPPAAVGTLPRRRLGVDSEHANYKWWTLSCTGLGMLLATINSGTLIIALPDLERALGTSILELVWVILAYMIASTVLVLTAGRLSDLFGRKHAYVGGFVVFALASLGAGFAGSGTELILWRIVQGIGAAFLFANAAALVTDAFPREQLGLAMGTNTMIAAVGLVIGPVLGGALVSISWHWVFWFNVPLGLAGGLWGWLVLHELARKDTQRGYDLLGTATFVAGLTGLVLGISKGGISGWDDPVVIGGLVAAVVLLPLWVLIERHGRAPMLDLTIFENRLFAAATAAAFINGLSRFALLFVFVFYYQGAQGDDPITAGIKLAPMALGMLVSSPLAGIWADRRGSRMLAALGMVVSAIALAAMTTLQADSPYWQSAIWLGLVGHRLGHVQLAQHRGDDGHRPGQPPRRRRRRADDAAEHRRGAVDRLRAGHRHLVRAEGRAVQDLLRPGLGAHRRAARALHPQHAHGAVGAGRDLARRRRRVAHEAEVVSATGRPPGLRIGEVAKRVGTTPRTIRYYEEIGILPSEGGRESGRHRLYGEREVAAADATRCASRSCSGVSLDELKELLEAEETRAALREEWHHGDPGTARRREMLAESRRLIDRQLALVRRRARRDRRAGARARGQAPPGHAAAARAGRRVGRTTGCARMPAPLCAHGARARLPPWRRPERLTGLPSTSGSRTRAPRRCRGRHGART